MNVDQGTLSLTAMTFSTPFIVTYAYICFSVRCTAPHSAASTRQNAPLPILVDPMASVCGLMPAYFPRRNARLVSCYALFK